MTAPVPWHAIGDKSVVEGGETLSFVVSASDVDSPPDPAPTLEADLTNLPGSPSFTPGTGQFSYTPGAGTAGTYEVSFTARDAVDGNLTASETLQEEVTAINQEPTAQPDGFTVAYQPDGSNNQVPVLEAENAQIQVADSALDELGGGPSPGSPVPAMCRQQCHGRPATAMDLGYTPAAIL